ncbi:ATP-dependent DNA helicase RecQ [Gottschalkia acidurici 9a]|uniref:DNA helicase RecQ n=1 Tax=Gottschalkia acidurici (strain ATCC 7906 / DSM 604 / BCRC 14475 / CIP 104303 / KCTC 5404 / NCIMB 10678 / 9a) TaxID=1128398 RepID=K0B373_GOTA9|nr:DNA helicase RecQ [Gottschalkia acidurici]AFS79627.1 ATP-dependent DNA helicase RecQ [Gottschalkia acidurici 9a]
MQIKEALKIHFGYDEFRTGQEEIIRGILSGRDALGIMPTGGGKSLCYQLPAILLENMTIVISPLISLMKDQVDSLNEVGIPATFINSTLDNNDLVNRIEEIKNNKYKIIYVAPERLGSSIFLNLMNSIEVSLVAIDEAHCISQWGHDFRPSYVEIPRFINSLNKKPLVAAFTATATKEVVKEIKQIINLSNPIEIITGFDRPNLIYSVVKPSNKFNYLIDYLENIPRESSGIIYCSTRKTVESLTKKLNEKKFSAIGYHGGMSSEDRQYNQDDFILDKTKIIIATNAFGMGINKPDVRYVIHYNMPKNMESYYQEAGRAGRDGEQSECILMYSPSDIVNQKFIIQSETLSPEREKLMYENLQYLVDFCHTNECLRNDILKYFGEELKEDNCGSCGNCLDEGEMIDITIESQKILSCIYRADQRYGAGTIIQTLRGSKNKNILTYGLDRISTYGIMKEYSEGSIREIIMTLVSKGYLGITTDRFPILKLTQKSMDILKGKEKIYHKRELVHRRRIDNKNGENSKIKNTIEEYDEELFALLRDIRFEISKEKELPPFVIFHDITLKQMSSYYPQNKDELLKIKGVGIKKYENYGKNFINAIKDYCQDKNIDIEKVRENINRESNQTNDNYKIDDGSIEIESTYELTYNKYIEGKSLDKIAEERNLTEETVLKHLMKLEEDGKDIDWSSFVSDTEKEKMILEAIKKVGREKLKPIKESLPDDISYLDIKLILIKSKF